jgi:aromatic ring-opening dioxygenase catalytic subunit (LigB family)
MGEEDKVNSMLVNPTSGEPTTYEALLSSLQGKVYKVDEALFQHQWTACQRALKLLGDTIREAAPDVLIVVSADQRELLFDDNMPSVMIYWGQSIPLLVRQIPENASKVARSWVWGYGDTDMELPVDSALGYHLIRHFVANDFDVSHSRYLHQDHLYGGEIGPAGYMSQKSVVLPKRQGIGHGWSFIVKRILDNKPIPIVPVMQNATFPPNIPTPRRCYALGRALREGIEAWSSDARVCVIASGGLSHFVTDEDIDRTTIDALMRKEQSTLCSLPLDRLKSAAGEIRSWITVGAACGHLSAELVDYVPVYRSAAGTGGGWGFMRWI